MCGAISQSYLSMLWGEQNHDYYCCVVTNCLHGDDTETPMPSVLCKETRQRQPCPVCRRTTKWGNKRRQQQKNKYSAQEVEGIGRVDKLNQQYKRNEEKGARRRESSSNTSVGPLQKCPPQCRSNWCPTHYVTFPQNELHPILLRLMAKTPALGQVMRGPYTQSP